MKAQADRLFGELGMNLRLKSMKDIKYIVMPTTQFKKNYKLAMKRGLDNTLLEEVIANLAQGIPLPEKNRDHALSGNWIGHRECHVLPDWLLI